MIPSRPPPFRPLTRSPVHLEHNRYLRLPQPRLHNGRCWTSHLSDRLEPEPPRLLLKILIFIPQKGYLVLNASRFPQVVEKERRAVS
jgi:hypothetical protein